MARSFESLSNLVLFAVNCCRRNFRSARVLSAFVRSNSAQGFQSSATFSLASFFWPVSDSMFSLAAFSAVDARLRAFSYFPSFVSTSSIFVFSSRIFSAVLRTRDLSASVSSECPQAGCSVEPHTGHALPSSRWFWMTLASARISFRNSSFCCSRSSCLSAFASLRPSSAFFKSSAATFFAFSSSAIFLSNPRMLATSVSLCGIIPASSASFAFASWVCARDSTCGSSDLMASCAFFSSASASERDCAAVALRFSASAFTLVAFFTFWSSLRISFQSASFSAINCSVAVFSFSAMALLSPAVFRSLATCGSCFWKFSSFALSEASCLRRPCSSVCSVAHSRAFSASASRFSLPANSLLSLFAFASSVSALSRLRVLSFIELRQAIRASKSFFLSVSAFSLSATSASRASSFSMSSALGMVLFSESNAACEASFVAFASRL